MFCSFNLGGDGRTGAKKIMTNANTNENTGAKVTINSRAPEVPSDGNGDGIGVDAGSDFTSSFLGVSGGGYHRQFP